MKAIDEDSLPTNPFPGLRPFREDEQHLFFGRENQVDAMVDKLAEKRFLAVVGTSGSGKSSLVNCGLRPALRQGLMARAGTAWRMAQFRPKGNPIGEMALALAEDGVLFPRQLGEGVSLAEIVEATLRMSKLGLVDIFEQAALGDGVNLLVVVDQFEELFRYRQVGAGGVDDADAVAFVNLLLEARERADCPIYIVLTMRSDFLGECTRFPGLAEAINAGQYLVPRLTRDERRAAITGPVGVGGAQITPVLVTRLVNDVGENPDQLSILQHALNRTWAQWENEGGRVGPIDLPHYDATGTMAEALNRHAERAFAELKDARKELLCQRLFKALTDRGTDARGIRRPTRFAELCEITRASADELLAVMAVFRRPSRSFLMPPQKEPVGPETYIDISHESLMRIWERLQQWGQEEAESAQMVRRLADAAAGYPERESLWIDPKLQRCLDWKARTEPTAAWARQYGADFAKAMDFLDKSEEQRTAQRKAAEAKLEAERAAESQRQAQAQREAAHKARRRRMVVASVMATLVVALVLAVWWAARQAERTAAAQEQAAIGEALRSMVRQSKGDGSIKMPSVKDVELARAQKLLKDSQIPEDSINVRAVVSRAAPDTILGQFPEPGDDVVTKTDRVFLVVATTQGRIDEAAKKTKDEEKLLARDAGGAGSAGGESPAVVSAAVALPAPPSRPAPAAPPAPAPAPTPAPAPAIAAARAPALRTAATAVAAPTAAAAADASACRRGEWSRWLDSGQFRGLAEASKPLYPMSIEGRLGKDNQLEFRALFQKAPSRGFSFNWDVFRSDADYEALKGRRLTAGYEPVCEQWFIDGSNQKRWQLTWVKK